MLKFLPVLLLCFALGRAAAQTPFCRTDERHAAQSLADPEHARRVEAENQQLIQAVRDRAARGAAAGATFSIPIVVHIFAPPGVPPGVAPNLSDLEVQRGLALLNDAFANRGQFRDSTGVDTGISFCLARQTPDGQPTNGILRIATDLVADTACNGAFSTAFEAEAELKNMSRWDCKRYLNIWLVTDIYESFSGDCGIAGFAYYPGSSCLSDGVMMESRHWANPNAVNVAAHEIGHCFNLRHTFAGGCGTNDCEREGDYVCDTPPDNSTVMGDCAMNSCQNDVPDRPDDTRNYMDYSYCRPKRFTPGQTARMTACLETTRKTLVGSTLCEPMTDRDAAILQFSLPAGTCGTEACPVLRVRNNGKSAITSMRILSGLAGGGNPQETNWMGNLLPENEAVIVLPCISVSLGKNTLSAQIVAVNGQADEFAPDNQTVLNDVEFFPKVTLAVGQLDSSVCGFDGRVLLQVAGGTAPFVFRSSLNFAEAQTENFFEQLAPGPVKFYVEDRNGCRDSLPVAVPDRCPPCVGGIINSYAAVTGICQNSVLTVDAVLGFAPGMKVLIYQAQGAQIDTSEGPNFGLITALGGAGFYETNEIALVGSQSLQLKFELTRPFDTAGAVQVVTIPDLGDEDVCNIRPKIWDGRKGGIVAFSGGRINLVGNVDASASGFRGGKVECCSDVGNCATTDYAAPRLSGKGGMKGEGISRQLTDAQMACRGKNANGGGGGNDHNAGGGGGGNIGAGGFGGKETYAGCSSITSNETRGHGGLALQAAVFAENRVFFGGGGGAGDAETYSQNFDVKDGGAGGGLVFIRADSLLSSGGIIRANGADVPGVFDGLNGTGGGGAGGSVVLDCGYLAPMTFEAKGGKGGTVSTATWDPRHGPGGGGGGGLVCAAGSLSAAQVDVSGGLPGMTDNFTTWGAENGLPGISLPNWVPNEAKDPANTAFVRKTDIQREPCAARYSVTFTPENPAIPLEIALNGGAWQTSLSVAGLLPGNAVFSMRRGCFQKDTLIMLPAFEPLRDTLLGKTDQHCDGPGDVSLAAFGGKLPHEFRLNGGGAWQGGGVFAGLLPGNYILETRDAEGCTASRTVEIRDLAVQLDLKMDSSSFVNICGAQPPFVAVSASGSTPYYYYSLDGQLPVPNGQFTDLPAGEHRIVASDERGCTSDTLRFEVLDQQDAVEFAVSPLICPDEVFQIGGKTYAVPGFYRDTLLNPNGCDTIFLIDLAVTEVRDSLVQTRLCEGNSLTINGKDYDSTGIYQDSTQTPTGCTLRFTIDLTVVDTLARLQKFRICPGDSVLTEGGVWRDSAGVFVLRFPTFFGCDSSATSIVEFLLDETCRERACRMFVPNAFSPNGDNLNDVLEIASPVVQLLELQVFDRWGSLLYRASGPNPTWDGMSETGRPVAPGLYMLTVRGLCADGAEIVLGREVAVVR